MAAVYNALFVVLLLGAPVLGVGALIAALVTRGSARRRALLVAATAIATALGAFLLYVVLVASAGGFD